jgi:malate dehydrogenase
MTREDLLKGNAEIAAELGNDIKSYCPNVKHVVIVFNPVDITGFVTLIYSRLKPSQVSTLAALDSTRLQDELSKSLIIYPTAIKNCCTYGGHGEQMAVFTSTTTIKDQPLTSLIGTEKLSLEESDEMKQRVIQGGKKIINLIDPLLSKVRHIFQSK